MKKLLNYSAIFFLFPCIVFSAEDDVYNFSWLDPDKEVFVLQNRKYRKSGRAYINGGGGVTTSGAFVSATNIQVRGGFFFKEEWGIEGIYSKNSGKENETAESVRGGSSKYPGTGSTPFRRVVDGYFGGMLLWAPFYSKINTFNKIIYMDWLFGLGYGTLSETNNTKEYLVTDPEAKGEKTSGSHASFLWQTALQWYLSESWSIRFNLIAVNFKASLPANEGETAEESWNHHYDLSLSLGLTF